MAGKLIVDTIDTDNAFITLNVQQSLIATMNVSGIYSNTGVQMIGANGTVSNTAITGLVTASQIATVANTQITGNLTATNIAGGTNGTIPYQSAANTTQMLAVGTAGQVLQTNGAGAPTWTSQGLVLLSTVTASSSATMDIETTFNSTYDKYMISVSGLVCATDGAQLQMLLKIGGTYVTSGYVDHEVRTQSSVNTYAGAANPVASPGTFVSVHSILGNVGGENASFNLYIHNPSSTTLQKLFYFDGVGLTSSGEVRFIRGGGCNTGTAALTGVRFVMASGNITSGIARLYGIRNS